VIYENLESDQKEQDSMIPVFTSKDYGMIASINQTTSGESQWLVVLGLFKKFSISNLNFRAKWDAFFDEIYPS